MATEMVLRWYPPANGNSVHGPFLADHSMQWNSTFIVRCNMEYKSRGRASTHAGYCVLVADNVPLLETKEGGWYTTTENLRLLAEMMYGV